MLVAIIAASIISAILWFMIDYYVALLTVHENKGCFKKGSEIRKLVNKLISEDHIITDEIFRESLFYTLRLNEMKELHSKGKSLEGLYDTFQFHAGMFEICGKVYWTDPFTYYQIKNYARKMHSKLLTHIDGFTKSNFLEKIYEQ